MADQPGIIRFGVFEVNLAAGELRKGGVRVKLQEQPFQVLVALLERPGEVITKQELKERLWAGDTFVDFDHGLSMAVNKIREAVGDSASSPRFVETVPRRGYRFIGLVEEPTNEQLAAILPAGPRQVKTKTRHRWVWVFAVAAVFVSFGVALLMLPVEPASDPGAKRALPLTSFPGREMNPAFSPDGTRVAFAWDGEDASNFNIYVQLVGVGGPLPLTDHPADDLDPSWSPDGRYLAFGRRIAPDRLQLLRVPALGGQEFVVTTAADPFNPAIGTNHVLAWSRSGDALIFSDRDSEGKPFALYRYGLESGERSQLTYVPDGFRGDLSPALSQDRNTLAFVRYSSLTEGAIHVLELDSEGLPLGEPRQIVSQPFYTHGPVFRPHSDEIVFSMWAPSPSLWRAGLTGSTPPRRLAGIGDGGISPNFSADGNSLVYSRRLWEHDIWRLELSAVGVAAGPPQKWIYTTQDEEHSDYSPNGAKIAFMSNRSGDHQIWVCDADGSNPAQLTSLGGSMSGTPRWSLRGDKITFDSNVAGRLDIYVMNANGAGLTRLTTGTVQGHSPRYSPNGKWIYFTGGVGDPGVWRIPAEGGDAERIVKDSYGRPFPSPDGRYVYHVKSDMRLWRVAAEGGEEEPVLDSIHSNSSFVVVSEGIYYTPAAPIMGAADILFHRFADGSVATVWHSEQSSPNRFAISRDGRFLLFTLVEDVGTDLMLVEDFQ